MGSSDGGIVNSVVVLSRSMVSVLLQMLLLLFMRLVVLKWMSLMSVFRDVSLKRDTLQIVLLLKIVFVEIMGTTETSIFIR